MAKGVAELVALFSAWKLVLLGLVLLSPGPGYDSSSRHLVPPEPALTTRLAAKLTRWDAVFFATSARDGYRYEHEWAFSPAFAQVVSATRGLLLPPAAPAGDASLARSGEPLAGYVLAGAAVSTAAHLASVLVLYSTVRRLLTRASSSQPPDSPARLGHLAALPFVAGALHVLSPAGIFLIAPYSEALFSLLSFTGSALFLAGTDIRLDRPDSPLRRSAAMLGCGVAWALSCLIRSNGLLVGVAFAYSGIRDVLVPFFLRPAHARLPVGSLVLHAASIGIAGVLTLSGFVYPQWLAYRQFCAADPHGGSHPEWCSHPIPAIYPSIQDRYWNVGFLRYWTPPNIPLFLLAGPVIALLVVTGWTVLRADIRSLPPIHCGGSGGGGGGGGSQKTATSSLLAPLAPLAAVQLLLAVLSVTNYHVQIITRLASGYPVWTVVLATMLCADAAAGPSGTGAEKKIGAHTVTETEGASNGGRSRDAPGSTTPPPGPSCCGRSLAKPAVWWISGYAIVQSALFASFLPPA